MTQIETAARDLATMALKGTEASQEDHENLAEALFRLCEDARTVMMGESDEH